MINDLQKEPVSILLHSNQVLSIQSNPFTCSVSNEAGLPVWKLEAVRFSDLQGKWHYAEAADNTAGTGSFDSFHLSCSTSPVNIVGEICKEKDSITLEFKTNPENSANWMCLDFQAQEDEHFLGLGERFDKVDQRGNQVVLEVLNGASGGKTYKPIPFFISSKGYGVQLLTSNLCLLRLATPDDPRTVSIRVNSSSLKLRLFLGGTSKEILSAYTSFCGRQKLPPPWVFGPWKSRDWTTENQQTAEEDIHYGRRFHLAGTVKVIDAAWEPYIHSFTFDDKRWHDPDALIRQVKQLGYKLILWISPWLVAYDPPSKTFLECAERGFLIKKPDGEVYIHRLANSPDFFGSCIDFTNPAAQAWWQDHIRRLARSGADGFKTDFGEQVPEDAVFYEGRTGKEMHNLYPVLYNRLTYEALNSETQGVLLARSAWDGAQPYCVPFAGDQTSDFGPATGLPSVIIAGQNAGLSGFPYWTFDIGGYFGSPTEEVFTRWLQLGAFSPIMQVHGLGKREPWNFSVKTFEIYRHYAQIHMDLFPYIYTYAKIAAEQGLPIIRALPIEFPQDAGVWDDMGSHEYCLGAELLVAPVYYSTSKTRLAYLPEGLWRDFWTGQPFTGGKNYELASPLELIPVMVKAGSIIPFLDPSAETVLPVEDPATPVATENLRLQVYPGQDGHFTLYDGTYFAWDDREKSLVISNSPVERSISVKMFTGEPHSMKIQAQDERNNIVEVYCGNLNHDNSFSRVQVKRQSKYLIQWKE